MITYIFGAGASIEAVPIVDQIPERIDAMIKLLQEDEYKLSEKAKYAILNVEETKFQIQTIFIRSLEWLWKHIMNHASIDTFAKKLYVTRKTDDYNLLKATLTSFLLLEQFKNPIDKRYDSFFAALSEKGLPIKLPDHVKIISWNYDFQFEKAFSSYSLKNDLLANQEMLHVYPTKYQEGGIDDFGIFKINGTTSAYSKEEKRLSPIISNVNNSFDKTLIENILHDYIMFLRFPMQFTPLIHFAWEDNSISTDIINAAKEAILPTEVLIIVGYSIPFFNREIDRFIIRNMKALKKIYIQAPEKDAGNIRTRLKSITDMPDSHIELITDVKQFFLPPEL
ncbi:MAG: hypothetical protein JEY96_14950 [Bacteroidales bacterium]|nr:hypothetical protein [Bacteroidales bacterium]